MTPKYKALELFNYYFECVKYEYRYPEKRAMELCMQAVGENIDIIDWRDFKIADKEFKFWLEVKKEINKL